jgi:threonine/homoserine efflux transporter RhtA
MDHSQLVHLVHICFTGPLLIYVALSKPTTPYVYWLLMAMGAGVALLFASKAWATDLGQRHVWFAIHGLLFASLLFYVGWMGKETPGVAYSLLLAVGIAAIGYHGVRLIGELMT